MATLRRQLVQRLETLGVENRTPPGRDDGFSGLVYNGKELAHFHNDNELDIRLTKKVIHREGLAHPPHSRVHPNRSKNSPWIEVHLDDGVDLDRLVQLVQLAIEQI